jgi:hypothetical protein
VSAALPKRMKCPKYGDGVGRTMSLT